MKSLPIVALVGQTNAGKSSLLNRMAHKNIAIVAREEGTTRDNVVARIDNAFILIDTAGLKDPSDEFEASIQDQIQDAIDAADLILVTLDATKYPDFRDKNIAKKALKSRKPVFLLLNKSDSGDAFATEEFRSLGIKPTETFRTSATTGLGIRELKARIAQACKKSFEGHDQNQYFRGIAQATAEPSKKSFEGHKTWPSGPERPEKDFLQGSEPDLKLALIGRPNVGKSSLFNSLAKKQQAIVSSRQGTTRDINRVQVKYKGQTLEILDTAGLRRPGKREVGIEKFSALRSLAAIEEADVCALLVDSTEPHSKLDQALAGQIIAAGKGIIIVLTKTDLIKEPKLSSETVSRNPHEDFEASEPRNDGRERAGSKKNNFDSILDELERDYNFLPYAPVLLTSSQTGANVTKLFDLATEIAATRKIEIKTSELNKILNEAIIEHQPAGLKNTRPKPKYIVQTDTCPPWFVVHGHDLGLLHWSWKRFLERKIREKYPFVGTPIMFSFKNSDKDKD